MVKIVGIFACSLSILNKISYQNEEETTGKSNRICYYLTIAAVKTHSIQNDSIKNVDITRRGLNWKKKEEKKGNAFLFRKWHCKWYGLQNENQIMYDAIKQ